MRLDKFLKVSRLIKRRTLAKQIAENDRVFINDRVAKPSTNVELGDIITIHFGNKIVKVKVLDLQESTRKELAANMYEIISEERI